MNLLQANLFKKTKTPEGNLLLIVAFCFLLSSCIQGSARSGRSESAAVVNSPSTVSVGYGRVLEDNPMALTGNTALDEFFDISSLIKGKGQFITFNDRLYEGCLGLNSSGDISSCFEVRSDRGTTNALAAVQQKWAFDPKSSEFAQVMAFYHLKKWFDKYLELLRDLYQNKSNPSVAPPFNYLTSIPNELFSSKAYWYGGSRPIVAYADCALDGNASFDFSDMTYCFGRMIDSNHYHRMVHDPTVVYHETGHALTQVMMNMRNVSNSLVDRADIKYGFYDESGAIQEGVADYWSHAINGRSHFGEWGLGKFGSSSRPVDEDDPLHAPGISRREDERLQYPVHLNYDVNDPAFQEEEVHNAGMIASHFLTAFTRDLMSTCSMSFSDASTHVLWFITEAYAELGDLTTSASDHSGGSNIKKSTINHISNIDARGNRVSLDWVTKVTPITYRSFFQKFSKYVYQVLSKNSSTRCNGVNYPIDQLEKLLDTYGLLLFKNYNENGNNSTSGHTGISRQVPSNNRLRTVLVPKTHLKPDPRPEASKFFVFDKRADVLSLVGGLQQLGRIKQISSKIPSQLDYNNNNGQLSPGEVAGVAINLYNDSNSTISGVQILANDWDHAKKDSGIYKPCGNFEDAWPISTEGAASVDVGSGQGNCNYITKVNGLGLTEPDESLQPVCFVQLSENGATRWASQKDLMSKVPIQDKDCLGAGETTVTNTKDCFVRAVHGADFAWYEKIAPKKNWGQTFPGENGQPNFNGSNVFLFEVNPNTPPGTTFDCRLRARYTNCSDCFSDPNDVNGDDFLDYEFSGNKPFKIIHFKFTVID